jgi:16S rRNA C1402 (ribose-2'-O) methylase RsmI
MQPARDHKNLTHRARIVRREKYRSCQKFVAHFEVEEIILMCNKNRSKETVEEIFKDVV